MQDKQLENAILLEIAKRVPYAFDQVSSIYRRVKSIDTTIMILDASASVSISALLEMIDKKENPDERPEPIRFPA